MERTDILENGIVEDHNDSAADADTPGISEVPEAVHSDDDLDQPVAATTQPVSEGSRKPRDTQALMSRLTMLGVAVLALSGLVGLGVAISREQAAANGGDDAGDVAYSYTCDTVSGSDPGVFGVGNCRPSGGVQASGLIPAGQAYVLSPRKADALGYTQSFSCSGGRAESPSRVVPKRCAAIGKPVLASR